MEEEKNMCRPLPSQDFLRRSEYLEFDLGVYIVYTEQLGTILPVMGNVAVRSRGIDQNSGEIGINHLTADHHSLLSLRLLN